MDTNWKGTQTPLRTKKKKNGIKSGSNIIDSLWKEIPLWQHLGLPIPTKTEFERSILRYNQDLSLAKTSPPSSSPAKNPSEARKCVTCNEITTSGKWYKLKTDQNAFNCARC